MRQPNSFQMGEILSLHVNCHSCYRECRLAIYTNKQKNSRWERPHLPFLKCNADVASFDNGNVISFGVIVRSSNGSFVCAKSGALTLHISVLEVEALSIREALLWMKEFGYTHVVFEVDNNVLFD